MSLTHAPLHIQPQIDSSLMLLWPGYLKGNLYIDLYGSYCPLSKYFSVEQVGLSTTTFDITDRFTASDFQSFEALINERLDAADLAADLHAEAISMQRAEWLGVGV